MGLGELLLNEAVPGRAKEEVTSLLPDVWQAALKGRKVYVRDMSADGRIQYLKAVSSDGDKRPDDLTLVMICLVDDEDEQVFAAPCRDELLRKLPGAALVKLTTAAMRVCGFF